MLPLSFRIFFCIAIFKFDFEPITKGGRYLDPEAAKAAIEAVANQGKK